MSPSWQSHTMSFLFFLSFSFRFNAPRYIVSKKHTWSIATSLYFLVTAYHLFLSSFVYLFTHDTVYNAQYLSNGASIWCFSIASFCWHHFYSLLLYIRLDPASPAYDIKLCCPLLALNQLLYHRALGTKGTTVHDAYIEQGCSTQGPEHFTDVHRVLGVSTPFYAKQSTRVRTTLYSTYIHTVQLSTLELSFLSFPGSLMRCKPPAPQKY